VENLLKIGDKAPNVAVYDAQGRQVTLAELWKDGPILLTFLRHFG
jgi:peroxiredoxin